MRNTPRLFLLFFLLIFSSHAFSQYGSLGVRTGKAKIDYNLNDVGFADLIYSYHLTSSLALVGGFTYSGSKLVEQFPDLDDGYDYIYEAQFSNQGYAFFIGPEMIWQIKDSRFFFYLRPEIGICLTNSNSELYKRGKIQEDQLEENETYISDELALVSGSKSPGITQLFAGVEGGLRFKLGKIYTLSVFGGINNTDYAEAVNAIIYSESLWRLVQAPTEKQLYLGMGFSMPIHGFTSD